MISTAAAYTKLTPIYPAYVNLTRDPDGVFVLTVRDEPSENSCGDTARIFLTRGELMGFLAQVQELIHP